jgi:two-component system, OmpR family, response regulator BaeR
MNIAQQVLIVEDEPKIAEVLRDYLTAAGYAVSLLDRGTEVLPWLQNNVADLLLLDLMIPGLDGLAVLRRLRTTSTTPVIVVTAMVRDIDRLLGLELGADDYICKPFNPQEVVARVRAVLRRSVAAQTPSAQHVELDLLRFELRVQGQPMAVTPVEFRLLQKLLEHPGRVYSRSQLQAAIYTDHRVVSERTVDTHVRNLRRKFIALGCDPVASVYGIGFRYEWSVVGA